MQELNFTDICPIEGQFEIIRFKGENTFKMNEAGFLEYDKTKTSIVYWDLDKNKIMASGRSFLADVLAGAVTDPTPIAEIEMGIGGYGAGVTQVDPYTNPLPEPDDASDLILPTDPRWAIEIDPLTGITIPPDNLFARTFSVVVGRYPTTFDHRKYVGPSEFALRFKGTIVNGQKVPGPIFAKKHKRPLMDDGESNILVRWTIKL